MNGIAEYDEVVVDDDELDRLKEAEEKLHAHEQEVMANCDLPLTFSPLDGAGDFRTGWKVATGILWINGPFAVDFWSGRRKKPKPSKCVCACCGNKHHAKR